VIGTVFNPPEQGEPEASRAAAEIARLEQRLRREVAARQEAEAAAQQGLRGLFQRQQEIALLEKIAVAANEADGVNEAMVRALEAVCQYTGWPLGHLWLQVGAPGTEQFASTTVWHDETGQDAAGPVGALRAQTEVWQFTPGVGLPGRVVQSRAPVCIDILDPEGAAIRRQPLIVGAGFASLLGFPVMIGSEPVAVLEFFSREHLVPQPSLLRLMAQIGTQLGRVIERRRAQDQLIYDALHDPLTKLGNRKLFLDRLTQMLRRSRRVPDSHFAVLFVDLDRFKAINDGLGHQSGDQLILATAQRLQAGLRQSDLVARDAELGHEHVVARLGGDEFVILLDQIGSAERAIIVADRIVTLLAEPFEVAGQRVFVTASVGIAMSASGYVDEEDILRDADIAMYHAKQAGRGRWVMFDKTMQLAAVRRLRLEADLRDAIARKEFFLQFQPIVTPIDGRVRGFEALLRWRHPRDGVVPPVDFIPVVEETGLIEPIGAWVLAEACRQLGLWQRRYDTQLSMSVNVSAVQFTRGALVDVVRCALRETGIAPASLKLELTESAVMTDPEQALRVFADLKALGVRVSLDDFGTGYSSLSYLRRLPIDTLKIDRSFVSKIDVHADKRQIAQAVLALARALGMDVVAEGVETEAERDLLREMGSDYVQGYFYHRPLDPEAAASALARQA